MSNDARRMVVLRAVKFLMKRAQDYPVGHERRRELLQGAKSLLDRPGPVMRRSLPKIGDDDFMPQFSPERLIELAGEGQRDKENPWRNVDGTAKEEGPTLVKRADCKPWRQRPLSLKHRGITREAADVGLKPWAIARHNTGKIPHLNG